MSKAYARKIVDNVHGNISSTSLKPAIRRAVIIMLLTLISTYRIAEVLLLKWKQVYVSNSLNYQKLLDYLLSNKPIKFISYNSTAFWIAFIISSILGYFVMENALISNRHPYVGVEQGSAHWAGPEVIKHFIAPPPKKFFGFLGSEPYYYNRNNIILSLTEGITIDRKYLAVKDPNYFRTANVLVIGGTGSGKTRFYVTPNVMQMHSSYVITDPKGELLRNTGYMLEKNGYDVRVLNLNDPTKSTVRYNPFRYIRTEQDILDIIEVIMKSTTPPKSQVNDPFWEKAEKALMLALFSYVHYYLPKKEQSIGKVMEMLRRMSDSASNGGMSMYGGDNKSSIDKLFEKLPNDSFPKKNYDVFNLSADRTRSSILVSSAVRYAPWNIRTISWLMNDDTIDLASIGEKKVALFLVLPDSKSGLNFIAAMVYTQLFATLYDIADNKYQGPLPVHVRFLLDEFPNIGRIPDFEKYLATMRSRNISANIIIQALSQLKGMYQDKGQEGWEQIPGNCDTILFLGSNEKGTVEYISKKLGKATIVVSDRSITKSKQGSTGYQYKAQGRELLTPDELSRMDNKYCVVLIRGVSPFYSKKFIIEKHPNYKDLAEHSKHYFEASKILYRKYKAFYD